MTFDDELLYKLAGSERYQKAEHILLSGAAGRDYTLPAF